MATSRNDIIDLSIARASVYGLLANIFREEPSEVFLLRLSELEFTIALQALDVSLDEIFENITRKTLVEDLAVEFTKLFIGPALHISPHESMHVDARFGEKQSLWGNQTVEVKKFMEAAGLVIDNSFGGMPDHISAELEFMQRLAEREAEARTAEDHELAANILEIQKRFLDAHLSKWVPRFCDTVIEATNHLFYKQFAEVTKGFIDFEKETLVELVGQGGDGDRLSA